MTRVKPEQIKDLTGRYHRNGVSGEGFWVLSFRHFGRRLQAVVFEAKGHCAVTSGSISECWRGDDFEPALRAKIASFDAIASSIE